MSDDYTVVKHGDKYLVTEKLDSKPRVTAEFLYESSADEYRNYLDGGWCAKVVDKDTLKDTIWDAIQVAIQKGNVKLPDELEELLLEIKVPDKCIDAISKAGLITFRETE